MGFLAAASTQIRCYMLPDANMLECCDRTGDALVQRVDELRAALTSIVLVSVLKTRTLSPNIREYQDGLVTIEARLNEEEQLFAEVGPGDQLEAVIYVRGKGSVPLQTESLTGLLSEVLVHLARSTR